MLAAPRRVASVLTQRGAGLAGAMLNGASVRRTVARRLRSLQDLEQWRDVAGCRGRRPWCVPTMVALTSSCPNFFILLLCWQCLKILTIGDAGDPPRGST